MACTTSEAISHITNIISELVVYASDVLVKNDSFKELASYLERIVPILKELQTKKLSNSEAFTNAIDVLSREIREAKHLTQECCKRSKVYLLVNCMSINKRLQKMIHEISFTLGLLLPLATSDLSSNTIEAIGKLCDDMQKAEFKTTVAEDEILEKIESGILENNEVNRSYANNLLIHIAEAVGVTTERSTLKKELEDFKIEIENCRLRKDRAEAMYMDQIIALLELADAASSPREKELKYLSKRNSLGIQILEPLQSFYCTITQQVMEDPVETSSGKTFERSAIEKWFAEGNKLCPLTMTPLDTSVLRPNKNLKQSIKEWKDRNTMIKIVSTKEKLHSEDDEVVLHCLGTLQDLCEQSDLHREWLVLENYIPVLIQILGAKNHVVRNHALAILNMLAKDSDDAKEKIFSIDNAVASIVHSLGRRMEERKLAVALLLELSKHDLVREEIGKVQGCILLLVTVSSSDDNEAARNAKQLLENLSYSDNNVLKMARANYFQHLVHRLSTGPDDVKMNMATALAEMELTNLNKASLFEAGVLGPLLHLVSHSDIHVKTVAIRALRNLSSLKKNGLEMIRQGVVHPILDLLFQPGLLSLSLKEHISALIMQLATSTISKDGQGPALLLLESDEDALKLFYLISFTGPNVQQNILQTFYALCQSPSASFIRGKLRECSVFEVLVQLCEQENLNLRAGAVKLFACLACEEDSILENINQKCAEAMLKILRSSSDEEEISSALSIVRYLPKNHQTTQWLLDAGALRIIYNLLQDWKDIDCQKSKLIENAVGALSHFTVSTNIEWQKTAAETGVISVLVKLLECGTASTKQQAASSLAQFSKSSLGLSRPVSNSKGFCCFSAPTQISCLVHGGICTVMSSFCLVEADAVKPLVRTLGESDPGASEASLDALLTLVEGERLQSGSKVLEEANAIPLIIKCLNSPSPGLQEKSLHALERIFRLLEFKQLHGASAHMPLVDLTQRGTDRVRSLAARVLAHLNVLHYQSSYF